MKIKPKTVLKTTDHLFDSFEQGQYVYHFGNTLCIKQIGKLTNSEFIYLSSQLIELYTFKSTPNRKGCFTVEKHKNDKIYVNSYSTKTTSSSMFANQHKSVCLSENTQFFPTNLIESIELLIDQFDSYIAFGFAKTKTDICIFLVDFNKLKIVAMGFIGLVNDIKINHRQSQTLSLCIGNVVKSAHVFNGFWEIDEKPYKKLVTHNIIRHEMMPQEILLMATKTQIFFMEETDIVQTITVYANQEEDQIEEIVKLNKGFLTISKKQQIKIYIQDIYSEDAKYAFKQNLSIPNLKAENADIKSGSTTNTQKITIRKIVPSFSQEQLLLRTNSNELYVWKLEELDATTGSNYNFEKVQEGTIAEPNGSVTLASGKRVALISTYHKLNMFDLQRQVSYLETQFENYSEDSDRSIYSATIAPDGNSLACAFQDKIKIFKVLLKKKRPVAQFNIKRCSYLQYSPGGQFLACKYGRGSNTSIMVANALRMLQMAHFKIHGELLHLTWSSMQDCLVVATDNNSIACYKITEHQKAYSVKIQEDINLIRFDHLTKLLTVSTDNHVYFLNNDNIEKTVPIGKQIESFNYVYPIHGLYFAVNKKGKLFWSSSPTFETYTQIQLFLNKPFDICYNNGCMVAWSSFQNSIFIDCLRSNLPARKQLMRNSEDIVYVEKVEINRFFTKVKDLEMNFEQLQSNTSIKLEEEHKRYEKILEENTQKFTEEIQFLHKKFQEVNYEKTRQQKENGRIFDDLEEGQVQSVNDLEKMYDRKLRIEKQKFMDLQQKNVEQKVHYEKIIFQLEKKYHEDIENIRSEYSNKLKQQLKKIEEKSLTDLQYKKKMQSKLINLEEESDIVLYDMQKAKDQKINNLNMRIIELQNMYDASRVEYHNKITEFKNMEVEHGQLRDKLQSHKIRLEEAKQRNHLLETEVQKKSKMVEERNNVISQQQHQIGGLEKAKYVLSFRTTEIRKELEPKESLIDKLKSEMFKLDEEFKEEQRNSYQLGQKVEKLEKLNKILKDENTEIQLKFKNKNRSYDEISSQVFTIVNEMDQKQWPAALIKLYQSYVKEDSLTTQKNSGNQNKTKDESAQEINRHLIHLEQSLLQVTNGNEKVLKSKDMDVRRKMKQNAELVYDLNVMRKKENEYLSEIKQKGNEIARLKRELVEITKGSAYTSRAQTAKSSTRRVMSRDRVTRTTNLDTSGFGGVFDQFSSNRKQADHFFEKREINTRDTRSRVSSGHKTLNLRNQRSDRSRFFDLAKELEASKFKISKQEKVIEELNHRLLESDL